MKFMSLPGFFIFPYLINRKRGINTNKYDADAPEPSNDIEKGNKQIQKNRVMRFWFKVFILDSQIFL